MSTLSLRNGRVIGDYLRPYIVAELNTSHFGDASLARAMIDRARDAGCDCVKFQSWSAETLYADSYYKANAIAKRMVRKFALEEAQLKELSQYAKAQDIDFTSTPYSVREAEFLVTDCAVPFIKIASMELNNLPYLSALGSLGIPLVLSTGMGTLEEIVAAVEAIEAAGNRQIVILHCTSVYPTAPKDVRLRNIVGLRSRFPAYPIGYSDHSLGMEVPIAAVALGACLLEKHFTLDRSRIGMDNQMATEPEEMQAMVAACRLTHEALGGTERMLSEKEREQAPKMRRSIVSTRPLSAGHVLTETDLDAKRPGTGISPSETTRLIGRTLKENVDGDETLSWDQIRD